MQNSILKSGFTLTFLCLLFFSAFGQEKQESHYNQKNLLKVEGNAQLYATPEIMEISIPLKSEDMSYENCSNGLLKNYNKLKEALIGAGIEEKSVRTGSMNISEKFTWSDRERKPDGYQGNIHVNLRLPFGNDALNRIIQVLKKDDFKYGYSLSFSLSESQKTTLLQQAIDLASENARIKAKALAKAMKVKLYRINTLNLDYDESGNDIFSSRKTVVYAMASDVDSSQSVNITPEEISISKSIGVIWEIW